MEGVGAGGEVETGPEAVVGLGTGQGQHSGRGRGRGRSKNRGRARWRRHFYLNTVQNLTPPL